MTQYDETVDKQRRTIEAEKWASQTKSIHAHSMSSMFYDDRPQDTENGKTVTDHEFNDGIVKRYHQGKLIHTFGKRLTGAALLDAYSRSGS